MDISTKKSCLANFLNVSEDKIFLDEGIFNYEGKAFIIATQSEAEIASRSQLMEQLYQFPLDAFMSYIDVKNPQEVEIDQNKLQSALNLVFKYGRDEEKQAFILQMLEPSELDRFVKDRLKIFKEDENGFAPFLSSDGKQHYSKQYSLFLYRYN
jgi:hypothetical protein